MMVAGVLVLSPDALLISLIRTDPWTLVLWRGLITAITMTVSLLVAHGRGAVVEVGRIGWPGVVVGVFFGSSTLSFVMSVRMTTAANTLVIIAAMPLFAALFSRIFLREIVPLVTWIAVTAGFAGIALVFKGSIGGGSLLGDALALATASFMAGNFVIIRHHRKVSMIPAVVLGGIITTGAMLAFATPLDITSGDLLLLALMGSVVLPVPLALMTIAPKLIPAAEVSLIMLLETFLGPLWVWLVVREAPPMETFLGGGILVGTLIGHSLVRMRGSGVEN